MALNWAVALAGEVRAGGGARPGRRFPDLDGYRLFHAIRADLLCRLGRDAEAVAAYEVAIARSGNATERASLERRRRELGPVLTPNGDWSLHRYEAVVGWILAGPTEGIEDTMRVSVPARLLLLALVCLAAAGLAAGRATTPPARPRPPPRPAGPPPRPPLPAPTRPRSAASLAEPTSSTRPRPARGRWPLQRPGQPDQAQDERQERVGRPGHRAGRGRQRLPGDHLRTGAATASSDLPTIAADLERIDTAWKALDQQINGTCPTGG